MDTRKLEVTVRWRESEGVFQALPLNTVATAATADAAGITIDGLKGQGSTRTEAIASLEANLDKWAASRRISPTSPGPNDSDTSAIPTTPTIPPPVIERALMAPEYIQFTVHGDIEIHNITEAKAALQQETADEVLGSRALILDMADVGYIDSAGLGLLIGAAHRARTHSRLFYLIGVQSRLSRILHVTGLDRIFKTDLTLDDALASIRQNATTPCDS